MKDVVTSGKIANAYQPRIYWAAGRVFDTRVSLECSQLPTVPGAPSLLLQAGAILTLTVTLKVEEDLGRDGAEESFLSF